MLEGRPAPKMEMLLTTPTSHGRFHLQFERSDIDVYHNYIGIHTYIQAYFVHIHIHTPMCACTHPCVHPHMYIHTHLYVCVPTHAHPHTHLYIFLHTQTCIYLHLNHFSKLLKESLQLCIIHRTFAMIYHQIQILHLFAKSNTPTDSQVT